MFSKALCLVASVMAFTLSTTAYAESPFVQSWTMQNPTLLGTVAGDFNLTGNVTAVTQASSDNSNKLATTAFVATAVAGGTSSGSGGSSSSTTTDSCISGCTYVAADGTTKIPFTVGNYQGYAAVGYDGMVLIQTNDGSAQVGLMYSNGWNAPNYPGLYVKNGGLYIERDLFYTNPRTPASSTEGCQMGEMVPDATYLYYCVSNNKWGRIAWDTSW